MCTLSFLKIRGIGNSLIKTVNTSNSEVFKCPPLRLLRFRIYYLLSSITHSGLSLLNKLHSTCLFLEKIENKLKIAIKIISSCHFHFSHNKHEWNNLHINKFDLFSHGSTRFVSFWPKWKLIKNWFVFPPLYLEFYISLGTKILLFNKLSKQVFYSQLWSKQLSTRSYSNSF